MSEPDKQEVVLNPGREQVFNITAVAVNESEGDPSQTFADALVAAVTIGVMAQIDMANIQDTVDRILPNATLAAEHLVKTMMEDSNGG